MWRGARVLLLAALGLLAGPSHAAKKYNITIGYLPSIKGELRDRQGLAISGALSMALEEINNSSRILPEVELLLQWNDTQFNTITATRLLTDMSCSGVVAFFGPEGRCNTEAIIAQSRNLPMISYKCSDYQISSLSNFARLEPPDTQATKSVISLLRYYRWNKFSILYEEAWVTVALTLENHAKKNNMTVNHLRPVLDGFKCCEEKLTCCAPGFWYQFIQDTKNRTRIYVFLGSTTGLIDMMTAMESLQLFVKGEYMVIFADMMTYSPKESLKYLMKADERGLTNSQLVCPKTEEFRKRAQSLLVVVSSEPASTYEQFTAKVRQYNSMKPFSFPLPAVFNNKFNKFVSIYAAYLYDSVQLYATALDKLIREETEKEPLTYSKLMSVATNGSRIIAKMIESTPYRSVSGMTIRLDERADSEGNFSVLAFKRMNFSDEDIDCSHSMIPVGHFQQSTRQYPLYRPNSLLPVDWPDSVKPEDEPSCGFLNEKCPKDDSQITSLVVAGTLAVTLFCALVVTISIYRKWKIEQEIEGLLWKVELQEISGYLGSGMMWSPSKLSLASGISCESRCCPQIFTPTARYKGNVVRIKELKFSKKKDIPRNVMKEMRLLRELRHDNLNSFIGAVVEPLRVLIITDYCAKGSLYDIIENEDIKLDNMFISSLVHDLIKGMTFIHTSPLIFHGNLKSSNCVVTSRWMLQVTDFGLHDLRYSAENDFIGEHQYYRGLLWKSPELLRELENPNGTVGGTQKGDVYAFGIILYEMIARRGPFGPTKLEPKDIVERVKRPKLDGEEVFRPDTSLLEGTADDYVIACMKDCWAEDPNLRPDFPTIRTRLKKMKSGKSRNIMDQMMDMMEKYANNLEEIVTERTRLLIEEKQKTEDLLHRMLPKSVAHRLTTGEGVEPESFDSVTIYFSDIVGFTAMSAESTPLQVVNFLNDLYTVFDRVIRGYDVYKVETIGDAYMVVSGLPIRNQDRHVGEIASMALELLNAAKSHKISHRPNETLKLRIGIHTGAVVAGVVGLTMPRYCLFGDTVNTASRMESNGEPLRIHISPSCKAALDKIGGYIVEPRGTIPIKGKGQLQTYWLISATDKAVQKRPVEGEEQPLFCRPRRSPRLADSRHPSVSAESRNEMNWGTSVIRQRVASGTRSAGSGGARGSRGSLARADPAHTAHPARARHALSSIASSTADSGGSERGPLRGAQSLDALAGRREPRLRRDHTTRSLDNDVPLPTVSGDPLLFNGTIIGIVTEDSPLLRKCSLYNKFDRPKRKVQDSSYIEYYKKWRSLENVADGVADSRKRRFGIRSWLLGIFSTRSSSSSLRRAPPLLDRESAV
ncbi:receptor-type guanylate cyclase Gyc76C isoform X1 [Amyelois transitella]|uniref:receptor-type guanylate cyclase Gyc76C isoform X1 n=1 Tax=Amyelois transitella TaxID=680683 RepID=UPI002990725B|nr:receptor-type guanylate cyclase Gyc76C isoform X1 [Amyelois transitella]XP_060810762.1 receptor-type guanylate cyclase Gyc76C isoform X1 [Amyelois transitella]XP_060810763.1 receptor-type guanylate cyclase Gyc76C isoform X1 [Amyelois transitella]XP_060810764.1 receptor-type guanylate cyclase Gyc76C isoform X1 [Amyelois transitella]XP_060810765.1 receptor-type guanylate cyclase Gyc76C isoform X1 [Amyelois transitella]XP_060810766.1 receptor-type guanylate cyclase Gyc76C isoform X1 [Amyelois 